MDWDSILIQPVQAMLIQVGEFAPRLLGALVILLAGLTLAKLLESLVARGLKAIQVDSLSEKIKISDFLMRGGVTMSFSELLGSFVYWLFLLLTFMTAFNVLNLDFAADLFNKVVAYIPNVVAGIFLFGVGMFFASFLNAAVRTAASNAGLSQANFLGQLVQIFILALTALTVLEQLSFKLEFINTVLIIFIASLGLGFAIALGIGTKDLVGGMVAEMVDRMRSGKKR